MTWYIYSGVLIENIDVLPNRQYIANAADSALEQSSWLSQESRNLLIKSCFIFVQISQYSVFIGANKQTNKNSVLFLLKYPSACFRAVACLTQIKKFKSENNLCKHLEQLLFRFSIWGQLWITQTKSS